MKLYHPEETLPIPLKYEDMMRQTDTHVDNVPEYTVNDIWTEEEGVNFSEGMIGTTRFQILRTRLPEGFP